MRDFKLPKTGETATVDVLDISHIAQVLGLQDETRCALPEDQKRFVLPQSREYFEKLLKRENGLMIGIHCNGQLIAQMAVMGTLALAEAIERKSVTRNQIQFHHAMPTDMIVIAKSMAVHPAWRGNELSQQMLESALSLPFVRAADHMFAQISSDNVRSWELFLKAGFGIIAAVIDPVDHKPRFVVQKPALGFALHAEASALDINPAKDFDMMARLTDREALVGMVDPLEPARLVFHAGADTATAWTENVRQAIG
jgi:ribosomal protein S18 acetylase RimI-like enzyme